jgi:hypothetical protein
MRPYIDRQQRLRAACTRRLRIARLDDRELAPLETS